MVFLFRQESNIREKLSRFLIETISKLSALYINECVGHISFFSFASFFIFFSIKFLSFKAASSVARGLSVYLDALIDKKMSTFFQALIPMNVNFLAPYPDFFSFTMVVLLTILLSFGVKESTILNNILTTVNLATVVLVIVSGAIKGKKFVSIFNVTTKKWISKNEIIYICFEIVYLPFRIRLSISEKLNVKKNWSKVCFKCYFFHICFIHIYVSYSLCLIYNNWSVEQCHLSCNKNAIYLSSNYNNFKMQ